MKLVTSRQMQAIDREAIEGRGIPGLDLMENAGRGIAEFIQLMEDGDVSDVHFAVFCGKGNNGGDGFVVGRYLHQWGANVEFFLLGEVEALRGDAQVNYDRVARIGLEVHVISSDDALPSDLDADYIVDAIFGTGFSGAIRGVSASAVELINSSEIPVIAVDAPSGLDCDTGQIEGACIVAMCTTTLALPKIGQILFPGREHCGAIEVIDIGIPADVVDQMDIKSYLIDPGYVRDHMPQRSPTAHKGSCGKLLVIAGSRGMTGAACMAAESAIRSGVGLCYLGVPSSLNPIFEIKLTEVITVTLPEVKNRQCLALRSLGEIREHIKGMDACIVGPGLGTHHETKELVRRLMSKLQVPAILDADGLNAFEGYSDQLRAAGCPMVITPHPGELSRLTSDDTSAIAADRMSYAVSAAQKFDCVVLLKGAPTFVVDPAGNVYVNPTGNPGLATGGSGDVLSGLIGSFLAQGVPALESACMGAYIHGLAADMAAEEFGPTSLIPTDIIMHLPEAILSLQY
jgi:hydroxyethylthiazole kinase-like uncharacterized protein yjeF